MTRSHSKPDASLLTEPGKRVTYRQRGKSTSVKTLDLIAVRWLPDHESTVRKELSAFGKVIAVDSLHLLILQPASPGARRDVIKCMTKLRSSKAIEFYTPVLVEPETNATQYLTDEITVRFRPSPKFSPVKAKTLLQKHGVQLLRQNEFVPNQFLVKVPDGSNLKTLDVSSALDKSANVEFAAPNLISEVRR